MAMPAAAAPADPPDHPAGWVVLTASERGAAHFAVQTPNQDSVAVERAGLDGVVTAVADGHGHSRHLRSARGSKFAVSIGCRVGQELADKLANGSQERSEPAGVTDADPVSTAHHIIELVEDFVVPTIIDRWREAVLADVAADPFTSAEEGRRRAGDNPTIAYGSTLLLCIALREWLILAQIGDGDIVAVRADGSPMLPIPIDPQLDGLVTTSLCGPDPVGDFRIAVLDLAKNPLVATLLATDGYGNAQVVEEWPTTFSRDLAWLLRERDTRWLASQLPIWAARCASAEGSADDTTVALLISPAGQAMRAAMPPGGAESPWEAEPELGSNETTIPAVIRTDTVPNAQIPAGLAPIEPVTVRLPVNRDQDGLLDSADASKHNQPPEPVSAEPETTELPRVVDQPEPVTVQQRTTPDDLGDQITTEWDPSGPAGSGLR